MDTYISLYTKSTGTTVYWISIISFLIGMVFCFDFVLLAAFFILAMIVFTLQSQFFKFVKLLDGKILISSLFGKDKSYELKELKSVDEIFPFSSIVKIKFKNGRWYIFWGRIGSKNIQDLIKFID